MKAGDPGLPARARLERSLSPVLAPEAAAGAVRLVGSRRLKPTVHRLELAVGDERRTVVIKHHAPAVALRNRKAVERWLPAVGRREIAPGVLLALGDEEGEAVWLVSEDLPGRALDGVAWGSDRVASAARAVADLHRCFVGHALLGEVRHWGGDLGGGFLRSNTRDALRALEGLAAIDEAEVAEPRERLLEHVRHLLSELPRRVRELEELGGPETLLHGDLWPENVLDVGANGAGEIRFIDWDHVGVGPPVYDLSTFLYRFPTERRHEVLETYLAALGELEPPLAPAEELNGPLEAAELARIASRVLWPAVAVLDGDRDWAPAELAEVARWFDDLEPCLP